MPLWFSRYGTHTQNILNIKHTLILSMNFTLDSHVAFFDDGGIGCSPLLIAE